MIDVHLASAQEIKAVLGKAPEIEVTALVGVVKGVTIGIGGLAYYPDGSVWFWSRLRPEARLFRKSLHRAALSVLQAAREAGERQIMAEAALFEPKAPYWLVRLGFTECGKRGDKRLFVWEPQNG